MRSHCRHLLCGGSPAPRDCAWRDSSATLDCSYEGSALDLQSRNVHVCLRAPSRSRKAPSCTRAAGGKRRCEMARAALARERIPMVAISARCLRAVVSTFSARPLLAHICVRRARPVRALVKPILTFLCQNLPGRRDHAKAALPTRDHRRKCSSSAMSRAATRGVSELGSNT